MKIQSSNTKQIHSFTPELGYKGRYLCPECSHLRKKKTDKCLAWDNENKRGYCHNCTTSFFEYSPYEAKQYSIPEWKNKTSLTDKAVKYFEGRMIKQDTLLKMKVYSDVEFMPQFNKEIEAVCFPYFVNNKLVNIKFRGANKSFKLVSGAELVFYNIDCLKENTEVIITEGEIDALTFINYGFSNTISVPNGANKNLEYLDNCIELFKDIKKVFIATDQDTKGIELRDELIRRFGAERSYIVSFKECKDANEYVLKYGIEFKDVISNAKPVPVSGIVEVDSLQADVFDLFNNGVQPGKKINMNEVDELITWETGRLAIFTGIPSSGKSEFVDFIVTRLNVIHGWKAAFFTPENYPLKYHYVKLFEKIIGKKFSKKMVTDVEYDMAFEYIKSNFYYILNENDFKVKSIIESARVLVRTRGVKVVVVDPYNKLDHQYTDSETQYISRFLDELITFAKMNDVLVILVAHPKKMQKSELPSLYDISGSAHFYNKTDYGITVHRKVNDDNVMIDRVGVYIQKIKFKHLGKQGVCELNYDLDNGRFGSADITNWLIHTLIETQVQNYDVIETDELPF